MRPPHSTLSLQASCDDRPVAFVGAIPAPGRGTRSGSRRTSQPSAAAAALGLLKLSRQPVPGRGTAQQLTGVRRIGAATLALSAGPTPSSAATTDGDLHQRHWQRRGRRRLHVCAAGGPSKKLGAVSSPRGSEV